MVRARAVGFHGLLIVSAVLALHALTPAAAAAHGRFPESYQFAIDDANPDRMLVVTTFGLVLSDDGGATWRWLCREVTGASLSEDPRFVLAPAGQIFGAVFDGLIRGSAEGCAWEFPAAELRETVVIDVVGAPGEPRTLYALTSSGGLSNALYRSADAGATWAPTSEPIARILFERVVIAPSDPQRIYLSGTIPRTVEEDVRRPFVVRSDDAGATWEEIPFALEGARFDGDYRNVLVSAVLPTDPDTVLLHVTRDPGAPESQDLLVRSEDGGRTWSAVLAVPDLRAVAVSEDGSQVWVGGRQAGIPPLLERDGGPAPAARPRGLWRSDDAGRTFAHVRDDLSVGCLHVRDGELWACGQNFADGFALARSADSGATFEAFFSFADMIGPVRCDGGITESACAQPNEDIVFDLALPLDAGVGACLTRVGATVCRDGGAAAGPGPGPGSGSGGCGCRVGVPASVPRAAVAALVGALILRRRR